uniref:Uncharacterized protein n=1 Tax=Cacopsylla melanoneura TaxID=428564 RepID=A0A8D8LLS5_9HEMI
MIKLSIHCLFCLERGKSCRYKRHSLMLFILILSSLQKLTSADNIQLKTIHKEVKETVLAANNSRLSGLSSPDNNEQVAYNQLLPYLDSKLPIPISLMNQLRKYNINRNMLNKIHSYNMLRRELHGKLIENEIDNAKYSEVLSKKFQSLFKSVTQEERKNFLNLINYLKMFNFDNKKLYDTLHNGNDLLKLINDNKIKYLPFMNTDKKLPDLFTNNKINNEIKSILIQYKISSKDLYNKLINKINPVLLEDMNKNTQLAEPENKIEDIALKNPYNILREKIQELTSFNKKPRIIPLNEPLPKVGTIQNVQTECKNTHKKQIDKSLDKYIKDLRLLNEIERERDQIINTKIDELVYPNKNVQKIGILHLKRNPIAELVGLYLAMSGALFASPNNIKRLPHIKKTKEDTLPQSHVEAGKLYNHLMNKNLKDSLNKIQNIVQENKHLEKLDDLNDEMNGFNKIDISPFEDNKDMKINGEKLFSALKNKQQPIKVAHKNQYAINGNKMYI